MIKFRKDAPTPTPNPAPQRVTVTRLYELILGRAPESEAVVDALHARPLNDLAVQLLGSLEFHLNVNQALMETGRLSGGLFEAPPSEALVDWAAARLPLTPEGAEGVRGAGASWAALYGAVFGDPEMSRLAEPYLKPTATSFLARLAHLRAVEEGRAPLEPEDGAPAAPPPTDPVVAITRLYEATLGRAPESKAIVASQLDRPFEDVLKDLVGSLEFQLKVNHRIVLRRRPRGGLFDAPPPVDLVAWAAADLPLTDESRLALEVPPQDWLSFYHVLFADPVFGELVGESLKPSRRQVLDHLEAVAHDPRIADYEGVVEEAAGDDVRGWTIDLADPDRPRRVQLFVNGRYVSAAPVDRFRRDLQDQYGGAGRYGYVLPLSQTWRDAAPALRLEVRDEADGAILGAAKVQPASRAANVADVLSEELAELRARLARIERELPGFTIGLATPVAQYDRYARTYYALTRPAELYAPRANDTALDVVAETGGIDISAAAEQVDAILRQHHGRWTLTLAPDPASAEISEDLARRVGWRAGAIAGCAAPDEDAGTRFASAAARGEAAFVVFVDAGAVLAPDALSVIQAALRRRPEAAVIYGDEDRLGRGAGQTRFGPRLRADFDRDLLLQTADVGAVVAISRRALDGVGGLRPQTGQVALADAVLRIADAGGEVAHVARVLASRPAEPPARRDDWLRVARAHLAKVEPGAALSPHTDILGAEQADAVRVSRPHLLEGRRAAVIIPSRDRADLLGPCLQTLEASRPKNRVGFDLVLIDNGSSDPEALSVFAQAGEGGARVIRDESAFNWALLNNRAVSEIDADVLIFLNDDTLVISPDWCDQLCEQALRPEVGAAGARLLYQDGTLQHAGIVLRKPDIYAGHEGVGEDGASGGYLGRHALVRETMAVTGACLATRRDVFQSLGGFDSARFPVEGNDVDYCLRLRERGLKVIYTPYATLYHLESKSRGFSREGDKRRVADEALGVLWDRWGAVYPDDPYFNAHFERTSRPFAYLRPPPRL